MEKAAYSQLELFSREQDGYTPAKPQGLGGSFLTYVRGYEKAILLIIAFALTGIVSFSWGVEKGKSLTLSRNAQKQLYQQQTTTVVQPKAAVPGETQSQQPLTPRQNAWDGYTVQLASYQSKTSVEKEAELLRKRGFSPLALSKGKYTVLCVGNFSNLEQAKSLLSKFEKEKRYKGCYVRRL